jgi:hypothetical protein
VLHCAQMRLVALMLCVSQLTFAWQPASATRRIDPTFDADLRNFCDVLGVRKILLLHRDQAIETSRAAVLQAHTDQTPDFMAEWTRRMRAQLTPDLFVDALVPIIARYFTDDEVRRLIAYRTSVARRQPASLPPDLEKKMATVMPTLQTEFAAEVSRIALKLGANIAAQIKPIAR